MRTIEKTKPTTKKGKAKMNPNDSFIKKLSLRMKNMSEVQKPTKQFRRSHSCRQELFKLLKKYWARHSDQRLGQLLFNLARPEDLFYLEDKVLFERLKARVQIKINKEDFE